MATQIVTLPPASRPAPATARLGGLPIACIDRARSTDVMVDHALAARGRGERPLYITSANGQVISICAANPEIRRLFEAADLIHADGQPMVFASRMMCRVKLPERVATTDLFHDVARRAERVGATFYLLGASEAAMERARTNVSRSYPSLQIVGARHGYIPAEEEMSVVSRINAMAPDFLWVGMGAPREQAFVIRNLARMPDVGVIKTSGGLFDFLSGDRPRAPIAMQRAGLEWLFRILCEPRRLGWRYLVTNPHALMLLLTRSS